VALGDERPSHEDIVATLRARTRPFSRDVVATRVALLDA